MDAYWLLSASIAADPFTAWLGFRVANKLGYLCNEFKIAHIAITQMPQNNSGMNFVFGWTIQLYLFVDVKRL